MHLHLTKSATVVAAGVVLLTAATSVPAAARDVRHLISGSSIRKHSIAGDRLKNNTVTAKQIKTGTLTAKQIKSNTLTGKQIKESSLGQVPAATALDGQVAVAFRVVKPANTSAFRLFNLADAGSFTASCSSTPLAETIYLNNTGKNEDVAISDDGNWSGSPFGPNATLVLEGNPIIHINATNSSTHLKSSDLTIIEGTVNNTCFWDVTGISSLPITR
jgi:hypothetical protein